MTQRYIIPSKNAGRDGFAMDPRRVQMPGGEWRWQIYDGQGVARRHREQHPVTGELADPRASSAINCVVCQSELTREQVRLRLRNHGKKQTRVPPPVCSPECRRSHVKATSFDRHTSPSLIRVRDEGLEVFWCVRHNETETRYDTRTEALAGCNLIALG